MTEFRPILATLPVAVTIIYIEMWHTGAVQMPVPFLMLLTAVVLAGAVGGLGAGAFGGAGAALVILHAYMDGFGPNTLTGTLLNATIGAALYLTLGIYLGHLRRTSSRNLHLALDAQRRENEEPLHLAADLINLGYYIWDTTTDQPIVISDQHAANHGLTVPEFTAKVSRIGEGYPLIHPDDRAQVEAWCIQVREGHTVTMEYRIPTPLGERWLRAIVKPMMNAQGEVIREVCASLDITEQKKIEATLRDSQRLDSIGRLSAGIAHDFNNLLAVVLGNLELLALTPSDTERANLVREATSAAQRGARLTSQLLAYGRKSMLSPALLDLNAIVSDTRDLLYRTVPADIDIRTDLAPDLPRVMVDRAQLESALLNLALNARDALPNGGTLTFATQIETRTIPDGDLPTGDYVRLSVSDTGTGIAPDQITAIWEPFYTTKGVGEGSGLGLAMVYGFAKQSRGHAWVTSVPGAGSTFNLIFPADPSEIPAKVDPAPAPRAKATAGYHILLVEDQTDVRTVLTRQVEHLGHRVTSGADGRAAFAALIPGDPPDLLLSDVSLPGDMQGPDVADHALKLFPGIAVLLISGNPGGARGNHDMPDYATLTKPVRAVDLAAAIDAALAGQSVCGTSDTPTARANTTLG